MLRKFLNTAVNTVAAIGKVVTSAGQAYAGSKSITNFIAPDNGVLKNALTVAAPTASLISNGLTKVPTVFGEDEFQAQEYQFGFFGKLTKHTLLLSTHVSAACTLLGAYFGGDQFFEGLGNLTGGNEEAAQEKSLAVLYLQYALYGVLSAATVYSFYKNDYKYIKRNINRLADHVDKHQFTCNINVAKTIGLSVANIASSAVLAYYWTPASLQSLPYGSQIPAAVATPIQYAATISSVLTGLSTLPLVYDNFAKKQKNNSRKNCATFTVKWAILTSGAADSATGGVMTVVAVADVLQRAFKIDEHHALALTIGAVCGASAMFNNISFNIIPGYKYLRDKISPPAQADEELGLLNNDVQADYGTQIREIPDEVPAAGHNTPAGSPPSFFNSRSTTPAATPTPPHLVNFTPGNASAPMQQV